MREPTLIVLGAGASVDLGFPTGPDLRSKISEALNFEFDGAMIRGGSQRIERYLMEQQGPLRERLYRAATHVRRNLPLSDSIDSYLKSNPDPDRELISKIAICDVIASCEDGCALQTGEASPERFNFNALGNFWAPRLFAKLHRGLIEGESPAAIFENVRFVTFNYDRVLEQFLTLAVGSFYNLTYDHAAALVEELSIWHVYGSLGGLSRSQKSYAQFGVPFGNLRENANRIRTFSETTAPEELHQLTEMMEWCRRFLFLGFSYAEINTSLLSQAYTPSPNYVKRVYGTCLGMSGQNVEIARNTLSSTLMGGYGTAMLLGLNCTEMFDDLSLTL
jgi:hypothetical protein